MKVEELLCLGNQSLHKDTTKLLLATILDLNPLELNLHLNDLVPSNLVFEFQECLKSLEKGEPLQYALKRTNFYGLEFYVDSRVLIPRFETEELVANVNKYIEKYFDREIKVLDLCSGSGAIGLTLKSLNKNLDITLSDISTSALEVALINKEKFNLDVKLVESDLFTNIKDKYSVIVCNPPYIAYGDSEVTDLVLNNEPHLALFAKNDGLEFYERILSICENYLEDKYLIAFEIGYKQKDRVLELINKYLKGVRVITKKDMAGLDRMVYIFKNINVIE